MADVVVLVDDLFFQAKILEVAKHAGVGVTVCGTVAALLAELASRPARLVILDLNARCRPVEALTHIRSAAVGAHLIAFLSHVQTDLAARAQAAGCNSVMPRSQFSRDLATILTNAKSESA